MLLYQTLAFTIHGKTQKSQKSQQKKKQTNKKKLNI